MANNGGGITPRRLRAGDHVRLVSPASTPSREHVARAIVTLEKQGLKVEVGPHAFDEYGYLAGRDEDRLADFNDAIRDPGVRAIIATRGGKGAYRITDGIDFTALKRDPKLLVGFSEWTIIQMATMKHCNLAGLHGAAWDEATFGAETAASFIDASFTAKPIVVKSDHDEPTAVLTTKGKASGILIGGNQDMLANAAGWALPTLDGAILLLEAVNLRLGHIDRQLTMLQNAGYLKGVKGVVIGQYTDCGGDATTQGNWTAVDVLRDRLTRLDVPLLGGLPIGHGRLPRAVPIGTKATLDADTGTLTVAPCVH